MSEETEDKNFPNEPVKAAFNKYLAKFVVDTAKEIAKTSKKSVLMTNFEANIVMHFAFTTPEELKSKEVAWREGVVTTHVDLPLLPAEKKEPTDEPKEEE